MSICADDLGVGSEYFEHQALELEAQGEPTTDRQRQREILNTDEANAKILANMEEMSERMLKLKKDQLTHSEVMAGISAQIRDTLKLMVPRD